MEPQPDDASVVRRCLAGDAEAWRTLVERYRRGMIELARRIVSAADAEDVVEGALVDLWQRGKLAGYEGRSSLRTWLGAVALNAALNARRATASRAGAGRAGAERQAPPSNHLAEADLQAVLHDAIAELPPSLKTVVLLYYEQDLGLEEIGRPLGVSKATVSRILKDARRRIRESADRLARERCGMSLDDLREGVDVSELDLDLRAACAPGNGSAPRVSKIRPS